MKSLKTIQVLAEIGKVLSKIAYVCSIIGLICCAVAAALLLFGMDIIKLGGVTLRGMLQSTGSINYGTLWSAVSSALCLCTGELFVSRAAGRYFVRELRDGTPFTEDGAHELMQLGISAIWIPIVAQVAAQVLHAVIAEFVPGTAALEVGGFETVALGVTFIIVSLLCASAAQLKSGQCAEADGEQPAVS